MKRLALSLLLGSALMGPALAVVTSTPVGNVSYTALSTDQRIVLSVAFTAPRTITLPSAGATCVGQTCPAVSFDIYDTTGVVSSTNTLIIAPAAGETINGSTASVTINYPFARISLIPVTGSDWQLQVGGNVGEFYLNRTDTAFQATAGAPATTQSLVTSAPNLVTTTINPVLQLLLSPGDWDCRGQIQLSEGGTALAVTTFSAWTSTAAGSVGVNPIPIYPNFTAAPTAGAAYGPGNPSFVSLQAASVTSPAWSLGLPPMRYSLAAATSVYLNTVATFSAGTATAMGQLGCSRVH